MIILYNILLLILMRVLTDFILSERYIENNMCTPFEEVILTGLGIIWVISAALILVSGWKSLLFGCKRNKIETTGF